MIISQPARRGAGLFSSRRCPITFERVKLQRLQTSFGTRRCGEGPSATTVTHLQPLANGANPTLACAVSPPAGGSSPSGCGSIWPTARLRLLSEQTAASPACFPAYYGLPVRETNAPLCRLPLSFLLPRPVLLSAAVKTSNFPFRASTNVTTHDIKCIKSFVAAEDKRSEGNSGVKPFYGK